MSRHDIFPMGVLEVLGALEGKSAVEMGQSLLEEEEKLAKEANEKVGQQRKDLSDK